MKILESLEAVIQSVDQGGKPLPSHWMEMELIRCRNGVEGELPVEVRAGTEAETMAWLMHAEAWQMEPLRAYFGPHTFALNVGSHDHWAERAASLKHPVLRARYADLLWELTPHIKDLKRDFRHGHKAVDAYIESLRDCLVPEFHQQVIVACRAFSLALQLRDATKSAEAKAILFRLHDEAVGGEGMWWKTYDRIEQERSTTVEERERLARSLEGLLAGYQDQSNPDTFNPWHAETAVERLLKYYQKIHSRSDQLRLHEGMGRMFEYAASLGKWMQASSLLQKAENAYLDAGMKDEATRARIARATAIERSRDEMTEHRFEGSISRDEMNAFLDAVVVDDPYVTCLRIASEFTFEVASIERSVKEAAQGSILGLIPIALLSKNLQTAAIGSIEDDLEGHVMHRAAQDIQWNSAYLRNALLAAVDKHDLRPHSIVGFAAMTGLFDDQTFLIEGVSAWFLGDHLKAIHVLTPQIECGLRSLTGNLGQAVTKKHPKMDDREVATGMGDMLSNAVVQKALGNDLTLHFRVIYSDPRALNLRNLVAHGLLERGMVNHVVSDLLIHTLLLFGIWHDLAEFRKTKASSTR